MFTRLKKQIYVAILAWTSFLIASNQSPLPVTDFDCEQYGTTQDYKPGSKELLAIARQLYNAHVVDAPDYCPEPRIPKIIHQIWIGSPFPEKLVWLRDTWLAHHPGWEYILWTDKEIEELGLTNKQLYDNAPNFGEKSDIARYEILYRFGGLYMDTDFECLRPFDALHHCCDFYAGMGSTHGFYVHMSIIGCAKNHPFLKYCIQQLPKHRTKNNTLLRSGPNFFTACARDYLPACTDRSVLFPVTYFYPWPHFHRLENSRDQIEQWIRPETFAIHHWHVSWCSADAKAKAKGELQKHKKRARQYSK